MTDVNFIKPLFEVYRYSKAWLEHYQEERDYFIDSLCTVKGITYEEMTGSGSKSNDYRMSEISDLIKEFEIEFEHELIINLQIVSFCESVMDKMPEDTRKLFDYYFTTNATMEHVAHKLNYASKSSIHENIEKSSRKLADISERVRHLNVVK